MAEDTIHVGHRVGRLELELIWKSLWGVVFIVSEGSMQAAREKSN